MGCNLAPNDNLKEKLNGDWKRIESKEDNIYFFNPIGIGFSNDSIEFLHGMYKSYLDTNTGKKRLKYYGNSAVFKVSRDSILYKNPPSFYWKYWRSIIKIKKDTLYLLREDGIIEKYEKLYYDLDNLLKIDQIILTRSGCYGSCPKLNISINRNGNLNFNGIRYTDSIGFYKGQLTESLTEKVFRKFQIANIENLDGYYSVNHTDDEVIRTSFFVADSLVKTVVDYGRAGPAELTWAYVLLSNSYKTAALTKISSRDSTYLKHKELFESLNKLELKFPD